MPSWLLHALKTIGKFLLPDLLKYISESLRKAYREYKISRQEKSNKDKAKKYEKDKSKSNANDLIDGL